MLEQEIELFHKPYLTVSAPVEENKEVEFMVQIGRIPHPMELSHHIEWIEIYKNGSLLQRVNFDVSIDKEAKTFFSLIWTSDTVVEIKTQCNIHGLWTLQINKDNIRDIQVDDFE